MSSLFLNFFYLDAGWWETKGNKETHKPPPYHNNQTNIVEWGRIELPSHTNGLLW